MRQMNLDLTDGVCTAAELTEAMFFSGQVNVSFRVRPVGSSTTFYLTGIFQGAMRESGSGASFNVRVNYMDQYTEVYVRLVP
jgi:hypothetical protein